MKVALITGASTGIGRALAEKFASDGVKVIAVARSQTRLDELAKRYTHIQPVCCDLSNETGRNKLIDSVSERLDYLVNNAGIESHVGNIELMTESSLKEIMETNLVAPMILTARLIAKLCLDKENRIRTISNLITAMKADIEQRKITTQVILNFKIGIINSFNSSTCAWTV